MQGMQRNTDPERRDLASYRSGPLEAAKRYLERERAGELAAAEVLASPLKQAGASRSNEAKGEAESTAKSQLKGGPATATGYGGWSGYAGQSIEAALDFETVFQYETGLEAEATEDWLDLLHGSDISSAEPFESCEQPLSATRAAARQGAEVDAREEAPGETGGQWLRQQWQDRARAGQRRVPAERAGQERREERSCDSEAIGPNGFGPDRHSDPDSALDSALDSDLDSDLDSGSDYVLDAGELGCAVPAAAPDPQAVRAAISRLVRESLGGAETASGRSLQCDAGEDKAGAEETTDLSAATLQSARQTEVWSAAVGAAENSPERQELAHETAPDGGCGESLEDSDLAAAAETAMDAAPGVSATPQPAAGRTSPGSAEVAADGPALAHDAGNLLSALKLYSELLSLSGVLQARHRHYAEDLKLLAARSEALITRLLRSLHASRHSLPLAEAWQSAAGLEEQLAGGGHESSNVQPQLDPRPDVHPDPFADSVASYVGGQAPVVAPAVAPVVATVGAAPGQTGSALAEAATPRFEGQPEPINLVNLLTRWGGLLSLIARGSVQVTFGPQAELPIPVAEEAMERILVNLVHNAMTATRGGGAIRIGVGRAETRRLPLSQERARPEGRMVVTIDDSGCGMSEEQVARLMGRSGTAAGADRSEASAGAPERTSRRGMGLQIVRELVAASGGELAIYSRPGVGTRIEIQWPTLEESAGPGSRIPPAATGWNGVGSPGWRLVQRRSAVQPGALAGVAPLAAACAAQDSGEGAIAC